MLALETYNPAVDNDMNQLVLQRNFSKIQQTMNLKGAQLLFSNVSKTTQSTSSATYVNVTIFGAAISIISNGGLVEIKASLTFKNATLNSVRFGIFIDGIEKINSGGGQIGSAFLYYAEVLAAGPHKVELKMLLGGGGPITLNNNVAGDMSGIFITEYGA